jgi:lon-related putative ATP-dependent protease
MAAKHELNHDDLRCSCDPTIFKFKDTSEIEPLDEVIGQERAVQAIRFGLDMKSPGYNIYVTGQEGTGKSTIVNDLIQLRAAELDVPGDWCMVNNFKDVYRPRAIMLPAGETSRFSRRMNRFIEDLKIRLPKEFDSKSYQDSLAEINNRLSAKKQEIFEQLNQAAKSKNLMLHRSSSGYQTIPADGDKPMPPEEFAKLPKEKQKEIETSAKALQGEITSTLREVGKINHAGQKEIEKLMAEVTLFVVKERLDLIREDYTEFNQVMNYLDDVQANIVENVEDFLKPDEPAGSAGGGPPRPLAGSVFIPYKVNVLVDRKSLKGAPVVFEPNPTFMNVFGQIEKRAFMGAITTDFSMVQAGSLLQANGGFLIMEIESVLMNPMVWEALKRALQNKQLSIEDPPTAIGYSAGTLRPQPIPLEVKVILLGNYQTFQLLQNYDSKFNKIFKVRADFDYETERSGKTMQLYARFIARVCKEEKLKPFSAKAVAAIVEYGEKFIASKKKLSLRFGQIVSIIKEADYWAGLDNDAAVVSEAHIVKAFNEHRFRYNLYEEKVQESYVDDTIMIDVNGDVTGQVNALAVYQMGDFFFGRPSRITAETFMGKNGVINIEREARLSGSTHDKGVLILSGFLGRTFAQKTPLSLSISITFEQNYGGIDGDSASSTELYAILSSLSGIPIRQGIAVTGSVNQKGQVQAIGGVNYKIEGFFDVCKAKGLNGKQGVLIPQANVKNLMLKREIVEAVKQGEFHIYHVSSIQEGIEVLTGVAAGEADETGMFPEGTVFASVQEKLNTYIEQAYKLKKQFEGIY